MCVGARRDTGGGLETGLHPGVRRTPRGGNGNPPTPVFLPGQSHGQRNLAGYRPQGHTESDTTERRNTWNRWMDMKMNRATAGRGRSGDWGAQRNAAWGNLDGFPEVLMLHLSLNDKQTAPRREQAGSSRQGTSMSQDQRQCPPGPGRATRQHWAQECSQGAAPMAVLLGDRALCPANHGEVGVLPRGPHQ